MVYMERSSETHGYTKGKLRGVVKRPVKRRKMGMAGVVLSSAPASGRGIVRDNARQLWFKARSDSTAYGNSLKASRKDRGFRTFEAPHRERYSAMNWRRVSGSIVV